MNNTKMYVVEAAMHTAAQISYIIQQIEKVAVIELWGEKYHCYKYEFAINPKTEQKVFRFELVEV